LNKDEGVITIRLGEGEALTTEREREARARVRARYGITDEAIVFGVFGALIPEKRLPQILAAMPFVVALEPSARLLLAGAPAVHYDVAADIAAHGLTDRVSMTGYLSSDAEITDHLAACDVSLNLRWPTARETSGPWLRALAAGRPTVITDLAHLGDVPALDPRTWKMNFAEVRGPRTEDRRSGHDSPSHLEPRTSDLGPPTSDLGPDPVCVSIDILDEDHSLRLAMRRLASDAALRARLGVAARQRWERQHSPAVMVADYRRAIADALSRPAPEAPADLPRHLRDMADERLRQLIAPFGMEVSERIRAL
jgi:hypothetical protein